MARKHRENLAGGVYHLYARGNGGAEIYADGDDRRVYLRKLETTVTKWQWRCLAYCLMTNHFHLLVETPSPTLSDGMRYLQGTYAQRFNQRHGRSGHVFQGRYGAVRMLSDAQLCAAAGCIARNPVEAGLSSEPGDWPWSSFRSVIARTGPPWLDVERLLGDFGGDVAAGRRAYQAICEAGLSKRGLTPSGWTPSG